jgi:hypothetical protein
MFCRCAYPNLKPCEECFKRGSVSRLYQAHSGYSQRNRKYYNTNKKRLG